MYEALSDAIADHDEPLRLLLAAPVEQRRPVLLLAAVNLLLAAEPGAALAAYYPTRGGRRPVDVQLWPAFAAFCAAHRDELTGLVRERSTPACSPWPTPTLRWLAPDDPALLPSS